MNPLYEYDLYIKNGYNASVGEWEEWTEKIVIYLRTELEAANNDYKRYTLLEVERDETLRAYANECAANVYLKDALDLAMSENQRLTKLLEESST